MVQVFELIYVIFSGDGHGNDEWLSLLLCFVWLLSKFLDDATCVRSKSSLLQALRCIVLPNASLHIRPGINHFLLRYTMVESF
jgi:hypothetical protein